MIAPGCRFMSCARALTGAVVVLCLASCDQQAVSRDGSAGSGAGVAASGIAPAQVEALSERVSARVTLDRTELTTAQSLQVTVTVRTAPGYAPLPIDWPAALGDDWSLRSERTLSDTTSTDGTRTLVRRAQIDPFLPGEAVFPTLTVTAEPVGGSNAGDEQPARVSTETIPVVVRTVLADGEASLAPSRGVVGPPLTLDWPVIAAVAGAVGLLAMGLMLLARRAALEARRRFRLLAPAHAIAEARLAGLSQPSPGDAEGFAAHLAVQSWVLRRYIEDRFGLRAPERTTDEFLHEARGSAAIPDVDLAVLGGFLRECDLVKFAGARATGEQIERAAGLVKDFIARTRSDTAMVEIDEAEALPIEPSLVQRQERAA